MIKKYAVLLISTLMVLTACSSSTTSVDNNTDSAVADAAAVSDVVEHKEVVSENIVEEFNESEYTFGPEALRCDLPKAFKESEFEGEYYTKKFPKDLSSINQVIVESDEDPTQKTREEFAQMVKDEFAEVYGDSVDINITQYDKMMITGRPALVVMYDYTFKGDPYSVLSYVIYNGTETNYVTYMQGPGADWMDEFIKSGNSIHFDEPAEAGDTGSGT